jgi:hypothetical protein
MRRIVRLTENDLTRLVRRVIKEQEELPRRKKGILGHKGNWYDEMDSPVNPDEFEHDEEIEFGPDDYEDYINHTETDFPENRWSFRDTDYKGDRSPGKSYWDRYQQDGPITLRKKMSEQMEDEENDGIVKIGEGMALVQNASSQTVQRVLRRLQKEIVFLAITNCEFADFSNVDMCSFPKLHLINLKGTENNLEENVDCDITDVGNQIYDFNK